MNQQNQFAHTIVQSATAVVAVSAVAASLAAGVALGNVTIALAGACVAGLTAAMLGSYQTPRVQVRVPVAAPQWKITAIIPDHAPAPVGAATTPVVAVVSGSRA